MYRELSVNGGAKNGLVILGPCQILNLGNKKKISKHEISSEGGKSRKCQFVVSQWTGADVLEDFLINS